MTASPTQQRALNFPLVRIDSKESLVYASLSLAFPIHMHFPDPAFSVYSKNDTLDVSNDFNYMHASKSPEFGILPHELMTSSQSKRK